MSEQKLKQHRARERFTYTLQKLEIHLRMGEKRTHLDTAVELLETLLELTGPITIETAAMQIQICDVKKRIAIRHELDRKLRLVRNTESN
jgi:hypothetical protein